MYAPFSIEAAFTELVARNSCKLVSTSISLCFTEHWRVRMDVVFNIFSCSGNICSRIPLSIACSIIWNRAYLHIG